MVDGWMGDDWFHYGAFRQRQSRLLHRPDLRARARARRSRKPAYDDYTTYLQAGSAGDYARAAGLEQLPFWQKIVAHPAYDAFWQRAGARQDPRHATAESADAVGAGLWDQDDMWGALARLSRRSNPRTPQRHELPGDGAVVPRPAISTARRWACSSWTATRRGNSASDMLKPFFDEYLKPRRAEGRHAAGDRLQHRRNRWERRSAGRWLRGGLRDQIDAALSARRRSAGFAAAGGGRGRIRRLCLRSGRRCRTCRGPIAVDDSDAWTHWLVADQRFVDGRPDVLTFVSEPLTEPCSFRRADRRPVRVHQRHRQRLGGQDHRRVSGHVSVDPRWAATNSRCRWTSSAAATATTSRGPGASNRQAAALRVRAAEHQSPFRPGHRIMVQVQSSWFPLYDRNPQTYVDNIFFAEPGDYRQASQKIWHTPSQPSSIGMPIVPRGRH